MSKENLSQWEKSGFPQKWVADHHGQWNHSDWLELLEKLKHTEYWPMESDAIGRVLEEQKSEWSDLLTSHNVNKVNPTQPRKAKPTESLFLTTLKKIVNELRNGDSTINNLRTDEKACRSLGVPLLDRLIQQDPARMRQAIQLVQQHMGLNPAETERAIAEVENSEAAKRYMAGCKAHVAGDRLAAKQAWIEAINHGNVDSLTQLGCYCVRGLGFPHSQLLGRACFIRALRDGVLSLGDEISARISMSSMDLVHSAISESQVLSESITDIIQFDRVIRSEDCKFVTPGRPILYRFLVGPNFPGSVCEGVNIVGFWEAVLPEGLSNEEKANLIKYPRQLNAAKDLRWILDKKELDINVRDIFSEEISLLSLVGSPDSVSDRLLKAGFVSGVLRHV
jgi:hypothetical protein